MFKFVVLALFFGESLALSSSKVQKAVSVDPVKEEEIDTPFKEEDFPKAAVSFPKETYDTREDFQGDQMEATMRAASRQFEETKDATDKLRRINQQEQIQAAVSEQQGYIMEGQPAVVAAKKMQEAFDPIHVFDSITGANEAVNIANANAIAQVPSVPGTSPLAGQQFADPYPGQVLDPTDPRQVPGLSPAGAARGYRNRRAQTEFADPMR